MNLFQRRDLRIHFEVIGDGRPLFFCHGLTSNLEQSKRVVGNPAGWRLVIWDCRYHGQTGPDNAATPLSFQSLADDLAALMDHLNVPRAVVGGVSMGAGVAARFAADHPERAQALLLVRPAWRDAPHPPNLRFLEQIGARLADTDGGEVIRRFEANPSFIPAASTPQLADSLKAQCARPDARDRALRLRAMPASSPIAPDEIARLTMPSLVIANHGDETHPYETAAWWEGRLAPQARLVEVPSKSIDMAAHESATRAEVWRFLAML